MIRKAIIIWLIIFCLGYLAIEGKRDKMANFTYEMTTGQADFASVRNKTIINEVKAACIDKNSKVANIAGTPASLTWTQYDEWVAADYSAAYLGNMLTEMKNNINSVMSVYYNVIGSYIDWIDLAIPTDFHNLGNIFIRFQEAITFPDMVLTETETDQTYTSATGVITAGAAKVQLDISENALCGDISNLDIDIAPFDIWGIDEYAKVTLRNSGNDAWSWKNPIWQSPDKDWKEEPSGGGTNYWNSCPDVATDPSPAQVATATQGYSQVSWIGQTLAVGILSFTTQLTAAAKFTVKYTYKGSNRSFDFPRGHNNTISIV